MKTKKLFICCAAAVMVATAAVPAAAATPPSISKITPNLGTTAGGNTVTIKGQNFLPSGSYTDGTNFYVPMDYLTYRGNEGINATGITTTTGDLIAEARYASSPSIVYSNWVNLLMIHGATTMEQSIYFQFNNSGKIYARVGNDLVTTVMDDHQPHIIKLSMPDKKAWYDGNQILSSSSTIGSKGTVNFGSNFIGKLYYIKIWKGGLLHTLVPVYNASTGEGGMFDVDDNVFYGSSTSSKFVGLSVTFGSNSATNVTVLNDSTVTCTVPPSTLPGTDRTSPYREGTVNVALIVNDATVGTLSNGYTYRAPMFAGNINPTQGAISGGNTVTITGYNFEPEPYYVAFTPHVSFDGIVATDMMIVSNTSITAKVPAHSIGTVDVSVNNGAETDTLKLSYTYLPDTITVTPRDTFKIYGTADPVIPYTLTDKGGHDMTGATVGSFDRAAGEDVGEYRLTFNPADWTFADHVFKFDTAGVRFTIVKAKRAFQDSTVSVTYSAGLTLGSIPLTNHYAWIIASTALTVADSGNMFPAKYIDPAGNYYDTTSTIQVNISKAAGSFTHADVYVTYTPGLKLSDVALSDTNYAWENGGQFLNVADSGHLYSATYTDPSGNYATATGLVKVHISKAVYAVVDITPHPVLTAVYTSTNTLSDVIGLQSGYSWATPTQKLTVAQSSYAAKYNADPANYNDFSLNITVNVTPGIGSASVTLADWTYGTPDTLVVTSATNDIASVTYMYDSITGSTYHSATQPKNVGSYKVTATFAASADYQQTEATANFTINKKTLTVTADSKTETQGAAAHPPFTVSYHGFVSGEDENNLTTSPTASTTVVVGSPAATYTDTIKASGGVSGNYDFVYIPGTLTITDKRTETVAWSDTIFVYNGSAHKPTATVTIDGTLVTLAVDTAKTNVGTYTAYASFSPANDTVELSGYTKQFTIVPDTVKVTARDTFKIYGAADPALPYTRSKNLSFTGALSRVAGDTVAGSPYAINQGNLTAGSNYYIDFVGADFTINKKTLTVKADNKTKTQGALNPTLTITYSGFEYNDNQDSLTTQPAIWTLADKDSHVNLYPIFVDSAVSSNYDFTYVPGTLTITVKHSIAVAWSDTTFVYDSLPHKPTATVTIDGVVIPLTVDAAQTEVGTYTAYAYFSPANDTTTLSGDTVQFSITPDTTTLDTLLVFYDYAVVKLGYNAIFLHLRKLRENIGFRPLECYWYHNGNLIGTGFVHSAGPTRQHKIEPGNYTFKLIGDSAVYYSTEQYLEVKFKFPLTIYPNPVSNEQLHIGNVRMLTVENASNSPTVEIYDIKGVLVLELPILPFTSDNTATIDVSRLRAGVYFVKVGDNISKVVVQ